jgi:hypothetical protein
MITPSRRRSLMKRARIVTSVAGVAILGLAGCSGGAAPTAPADGAVSGAVVTAPEGTATDSGGSTGVIDVCAVVTAADAAPLFSGPVTTKTEPGLVGQASGCDYISTRFPDDESLSIEVVLGDQAASFWTGNIAPQGEDTIPLTGIGDQAARQPGTPDLVSIKGSIFCEAETGSGNTEVYAGLATPDASDNIPDDAATAFAERIGALCNKIFASQ